MLCIQCPGSLLVVLYFIIRRYTVSTWLPYAVAASMQGTLIWMLLYFYLRDRVRGRDDERCPHAPLLRLLSFLRTE